MAAPGCRNHNLRNSNVVMCVDDRGSENINVRLSTGSASNLDWSMRLQRLVNGTWVTVGSRTGYVSSTSASTRLFENVGRLNASMRVNLTIAGQTVNSPTWTR